MTSRSKDSLTPSPESGEGGPDPVAALAALDDALGAVSPDDVSPENRPESSGARESGEKPKRKYTRRGKVKASEPEPVPPPSPEMMDAYTRSAGAIIDAAFRIMGRFAGGSPETWQLTAEERERIGMSFGPVLELHHQDIGKYLPYMLPMSVVGEVFLDRWDRSRAEVAGERARLEKEGGKAE